MMTEQDTPAIGTQYPLLFTYRDTFFGDGILFEVQATNGRALCVREDDGFWIYGINPGGMAAHGEDPESAHTAFRKAFSHILLDLLRESDSLLLFEEAVQKFFDATNEGYEADWRTATKAVRRGDVTLDGVPTVPANSPRSIRVSIKQLEAVTTQDNTSNIQYLLAA